MKGTYISHQTPLFASETNAFRLELVLGAEVQPLEGVDIDVAVYTSQLSPRVHVKSVYADWIAGKSQEGSGYIVRSLKDYTLVLTPDFLRNLPTGILTFSITYTKGLMIVTNVLVTEKYINDVSSQCHAGIK